MSVGDRGTAVALASAAGAGAVFLSLWLALGIPLPWSAAAAAAGYGALWMMTKSRKRAAEKPVFSEPEVDMELARRTVEKGRLLANELRGSSERSEGTLARGLAALAERMESIASDVEADPKDAQAASTFLAIQGEAAARIAKIASDLRIRGADGAGIAEARVKIDSSIARLIKSFDRQISSLQDDNLAELESELDLIEGSISLEEEEAARSSDTEASR